MEYIINSTRQESEIVITNVTITFDDSTTINVDVAHYLPNSIDEITQNILNRIQSEQYKLDTIKNMSNLIEQIPTNQPIII